MKKITFIFLALFFSGFLLSCEEAIETTKPTTLWFGNAEELIYEDATLFVSIADTFQIQVSADNGTAFLSTLTFIDDSVQIDTSDTNSSILSIESLNSNTKYNENPLLLSTTDQQGFTSTWTFVVQEPLKEDSIINTYSFRLEDEEGYQRTISLDLLILPDTATVDSSSEN